jgi:hypothetical protein
MSEQPASKEKLAAMTPEEIVDTLSTIDLAVIGELSIKKYIKELRGDRFANSAHNAWVFKMSCLGILKEFEK